MKKIWFLKTLTKTKQDVTVARPGGGCAQALQTVGVNPPDGTQWMSRSSSVGQVLSCSSTKDGIKGLEAKKVSLDLEEA